MSTKKLTLLWFFLATCMMLVGTASATDRTRFVPTGPVVALEPVTELKGTDAHTYNGYLRIYVVEPTSRYKDYYNTAYSFGTLDIPFNQAITVGYSDTVTKAFTWTGTTYAPLNPANIMIIAVVSNGTGHAANCGDASNPGPFTAYWVDASAVATPGVPGIDSTTGAYTHHTFVDEATQHG